MAYLTSIQIPSETTVRVPTLASPYNLEISCTIAKVPELLQSIHLLVLARCHT